MLKWKEELENSNIVVAVFLDFKRAFETIDRKILLAKLFKYGIRGNELNWFVNYLENRTQSTKFNEATSEWREINIGVPQGSKLAATLFSLHMMTALFIIVEKTLTI